MNMFVLAIGLVLAIEGLVLALIPRRLEDLMKLLLRLPPDLRRGLGLCAMAVGVALVWAAETLT